jgi:hypothetical protein
MTPLGATGDMKSVRVRVSIVAIHGNGKEEELQQLWKDVPLAEIKNVKYNAPGACVDAIAALFGTKETHEADE